MTKIEAELDELTRSVEEQIGRAIVEAAEAYLLAFIRVARSNNQTLSLEPQRDKLFDAIAAAMLLAKKKG